MDKYAAPLGLFVIWVGGYKDVAFKKLVTELLAVE